MASFGAHHAPHWLRLRFTGEGEPPSRDYVGKAMLFKSNMLTAKDIYSFIAMANRREFELCFFEESVLRRFLKHCHTMTKEGKWQKWSFESSIMIDIVNIIVKLWTGRVPDQDVETCLKRYCKILEGPFKRVDPFGTWYRIRKCKVQ